MKKIVLVLCLGSLFSVQAFVGAVGMAGARLFTQGAIRGSQIAMRSAGNYTQKKIAENPKAALGAAGGAWIGGHAAGDTPKQKFYGTLGGALTGWHLVRQHVALRALQTESAVSHARVFSLEKSMAHGFQKMGQQYEVFSHQMTNHVKNIYQELSKFSYTQKVPLKNNSGLTERVKKLFTGVQEAKTHSQTPLSLIAL